jgi:nitrous oxidase accessory protein NosD
LLSPFMRTFQSVLAVPQTLLVTSSADDGLGSLRSAIVDADRSSGRVRILVRVPEIALSTTLPPIVNPDGVTLESERGTAHINAAGMTGAVIDIDAPRTTVSNVRITGGQAGVVVRAADASLRSLFIDRSGVGVFVGAAAVRTHVDSSTFLANGVGVQIDGRDSTTTIENSRFESNRTAAIWAVTADADPDAHVAILGNRFRNDVQGAVIVGFTTALEHNAFDQPNGDAIHASMARITIRDNRMRGALGFGVYLERSAASRIERNEIANNCAGGIMVREATNAQLERNQLFQNGHGIVILQGSTARPNEVVDNLIADHVGDGVAMIGAAAVISGNRILRNRHVGLHMSSLTDTDGRKGPDHVLLAKNVLDGNGRDEEHDVFAAESAAAATGAQPRDCSWRHGVVGLVALTGAAP